MSSSSDYTSVSSDSENDSGSSNSSTDVSSSDTDSEVDHREWYLPEFYQEKEALQAEEEVWNGCEKRG